MYLVARSRLELLQEGDEGTGGRLVKVPTRNRDKSVPESNRGPPIREPGQTGAGSGVLGAEAGLIGARRMTGVAPIPTRIVEFRARPVLCRAK